VALHLRGLPHSRHGCHDGRGPRAGKYVLETAASAESEEGALVKLFQTKAGGGREIGILLDRGLRLVLAHPPRVQERSLDPIVM
jgi:hypothetical protein